MAWIIGLALGLIIGALAYVRLAPSDPVRWHRLPQEVARGAVVEIPAKGDALSRLDRIALDWPRTRRLAGSPAEGMITYVTRSGLIGYPDYTTVQLTGDQLRLWGRQRFGTEDFGVNAKRLNAWQASLEAGAEEPRA
ncbi:DUF1499 domain-containing protein [Pseudooceanicola aestuarii]|uniref:DUF1499 domain-containing protein n=1 Tax=Pseudooceanicola aestuarii TaxID=2697319 RepID=UPI0013D31549|nr:DUF1499 domain-containing protein [Pseudooceanicola aestuarii]